MESPDREFLEHLAHTFDTWPRLMLAQEGPEGNSFVRISDELLRELSKALRHIARRMV